MQFSANLFVPGRGQNTGGTQLRKVLNAHSKTLIEALYLELGCLPIRYIIMARRINYLYYLTHLNDNELLSKFFAAQKDSPKNGDWILTVKETLKEVGIEMNDVLKKKKDCFQKSQQNEKSCI